MSNPFAVSQNCRKYAGYCCFEGYYIRDVDEIEVPDRIDGLPVRELVARAFQYTGAKRVTLPDGIRNIRDAFRYCGKLEQVNIPASTQRIEAYAFQDCTNLMRLRIPSSVTFIEDRPGQVPFIGCGGAKKTGKRKTERVTVGPYRVPLCGFDSETRYTYGDDIEIHGDYAVVPAHTTTLTIEEYNPGPYGDLTLIVDKGSYAEKYAKRMNIKYELA